MSGGIGLTTAAADRDKVLRAGLGYTGANFAWHGTTNAAIMIDGSFYYMLTPFLAGDVVTNLHVRVSNAAVTVSLSKMGLYALDGQTLLAQTASLGASWETAGGKTHALASPYTVPSTGCLYIGMVCKAGTLPQLLGVSLAGYFTYKLASGSHPWGVTTGNTDLPASFTPNGDTGSPRAYWVGWS